MLDKIKEMKVEKKLKYCFTLVVIVSSISGVLGIIMLMYTNSKHSEALVANGFSQGQIGTFSTYLNKEPAIIREMILLKNQEDIVASLQELQEVQQQTDAAYEVMLENCTTAAEMEYINNIAEQLPVYREVFSRVQDLAAANQKDAATKLLVEEAKPTLKALTNEVEALIQLNVEMGNNVSRTLTITEYIALALMVIVLILAIVISVWFAGYVAKLFSVPIGKVKDASVELARGNLNIEIQKMYPDEIGEMTDSFQEAAEMIKLYIRELSRGLGEVAQGNFNIATDVEFKGDFHALADSLNRIIQSLSGTLGNIYESSEQVSMGATQMAQSAQSLAEGATNQAASVEELTATIQNITETIVHSSEKAEESFHNAERFKKEAEASNEEIKDLNLAMERINETSKEIANIITAIEDIASQTNLLSLNASIEAARAGEAGRGFAVVADQIGKLAADSATSAVNTKNLIEHAIQEIERGNEIMLRATGAIESVIQGISTLAASTNEISTLSASQADAMRQLEIGIEQISEVIQNNSAAAEQTSATSQELSAQSESLEHMVGQFSLKE